MAIALLFFLNLFFAHELCRLVWVDGGYTGDNLARVVRQLCNARVEVIKRSDNSSGFQLLPRRWVVERTFS